MATQRKQSLFFMITNFFLLSGLAACQGDGSGASPEGSVVATDTVYNSWPNETTSSPTSNQIVSKVLASDLNADGVFENIFISVLPNSSNATSSILRVTESSDNAEIANYQNQFLLQDSIPFSVDLNKNGQREILIPGIDLEKIFAFEFKNNDLGRFYVRWSKKLPKKLDPGFARQLQKVIYKDQEVIKIGQYGVYEKTGKPKVVSLSKLDDDEDDD